MRARAGDPARNMPQKILAGRAEDPSLSGDLVRVRVDQVILAEDPMRVLSALTPSEEPRRFAVETAVAYDPQCINLPAPRESSSEDESLDSLAASAPQGFLVASAPRGSLAASAPRGSLAASAPQPVVRSLVRHGLAIGRAGIGFPAAVHLERFAAPARLALTDNPRLAGLGGTGMLTLLASQAQLQIALTQGVVSLRPPRSVQVLLSGKLRPFVGVRDLALELRLRGLEEIVHAIDKTHAAPVVLEFAGPSARLMSVSDRALLCSLAPRVGASAGLFLSDEKTEVYLRDQRRSKAFRGLTPDAGAPCDNVITVDLSTIDPLILDSQGKVRPIRELEGQPVHQVILGGDTGASLRDTLAVSTLLKSKRVPPELDFLVACASRQTLEVMAQCDALVDMLATGARLVEPDPRLLSGQLYRPAPGSLSIRTFDTDWPRAMADSQCLVASPDAIALAVATGHIGDPRSFKRPVRITVPRTLPTEDVLVVRKPRGKDNAASDLGVSITPSPPTPWNAALTLKIYRTPLTGTASATVASTTTPADSSRTSDVETAAPLHALIASTADALRRIASQASRLSPALRLVVAEHIPAGTVSMLATSGIVALTATEAQLKELLDADNLATLPVKDWSDEFPVTVNGTRQALVWLANTQERAWILAGGPPDTAPS